MQVRCISRQRSVHLLWELLVMIEGVGASPARLWMPRCDNFDRTISTVTCSKCADNRFRNDDCMVDGHPCMEAIQSL